MKTLGKLLLLIVVILVAAKFGIGPKDYSSPKATDLPSAKLDQIVDPAMLDTITKLIMTFGLNCPAAKLVYKQGPDAFGDVLKVWCGPVGIGGVYEKAVFRVTFRPNDLPSVRPWSD
jgi:hypothetical protein